MSPTNKLSAVLFDLDGTLLDTAPDIVGALNDLLRNEGAAPLPVAALRNSVGRGAQYLIETAFPEAAGERSERLRQAFLNIYRDRLGLETRLFIGMDAVLAELANRGIVMGIVTNKLASLTLPLIEHMGIARCMACVVSGDSVAQPKPHPLPLLHAAELLALEPQQCLYVGDGERDVRAARAAAMPILVARYGYIEADEDPASWAADGYLSQPVDLLAWLDSEAAAGVFSRP